MSSPGNSLRRLVDMALEEDMGSGDKTSLWTVPERAEAKATVVTREDPTIAGTAVAAEVFRRVDSELEVETVRADGERVAQGTVVMTLRGRARSILAGERTALNFLGRLSGIATLTRAFVDAVTGTGAEILDTRKTTPGWRELEKAAVRAGGGRNHRMGLHDMVLIKENHIAAAGGLTEAVGRVRERNVEGLGVEVEVGTLEELRVALDLKVRWVLLDNMPPELLKRAVGIVRSSACPDTRLEASGNVTLGTVRVIAETGVDFVSVGALTHSAPLADLTLRIDG